MRRSTVQQHTSDRVRAFAVKVEGEGWIGVSVVGDRCRDHGHQTPEQAKLCALHRAQVPGHSGNVVLMPLSEPVRDTRRRAARAR
jgi:hypothetical protein